MRAEDGFPVKGKRADIGEVSPEQPCVFKRCFLGAADHFDDIGVGSNPLYGKGKVHGLPPRRNVAVGGDRRPPSNDSVAVGRTTHQRHNHA